MFEAAGRKAQDVSIHAPREGSDDPCAPVAPGHAVSIHAPREGSDGL